MKLHTPKEPQHVRDWVASLEKTSNKAPGIKWENLNVWYGNQLPKYLWREWGVELKSRGFTWQKFLKLLSRRTDSVLLWHKGLRPWDEFVETVIDLLEGPLGQEIAKR